MAKFKLSVLLLIILITTAPAGSQGILFNEGPWKDALEMAKKEEKLLFVDAYAKWCGPCKRMASEVFTQEKVGTFFNKNFINLKIDMEESDGISFGQKYPVSAYPTLFFINGDGEVVRKVRGAQQADNLIEQAKMAIKANDKSPHYTALYEDGNRDYKTVLGYIRSLNAEGKPSLKVANDYLLSKPAISDEQMAVFLFEAATEADSRIFEMMLTYKSDILKQVDRGEYKQKVVDACSATIIKSIEYDAEMLRDEALDKCKQALGEDAEIEILKLKMAYAYDMKDEDAYFKYAEDLGKKGKKDFTLYKFLTEDLMSKYKTEQKALKLAARYSKELCNKYLNAENAILRCMVMIETKEYDNALEFIEESLEKIPDNDPLRSRLKSVTKYIDGLKQQQSVN